MELIFKIAGRNILRHKGKSLVIGIILLLGALLMTLGNGVISGMEKGMTKNIIDGFIGNLVVISDKNEADNVLFTMMGSSIEPINNYKEIKQILLQQPEIDKFLPAGRDMAMILDEESGTPGNIYLLGVEFDKYRQIFPENIKFLEGRPLNNYEPGVLIPTFARKIMYENTNVWYIPQGAQFSKEQFLSETKEKEVQKNLVLKDNIVFLGYTDKNTALDIRAEIKGIIKYNTLNSIFGMFCLIDIESYRNCLGYFSAKDKTVELTPEKKRLLAMGTENMDELFNTDSLIVENKPASSLVNLNQRGMAKPEQPPSTVDLETGTYNLVLVKLKKNSSLTTVLKKVNQVFKDKKVGVRAVSWKSATGFIGSMAVLIKSALFIFVMFLFFVAMIIIVNTLSMAAIERTSEIGMMRAVGARKGFISKMFIVETGILSLFFGGIGIILGIVVVKLIPLFNITSQNDMVQLLFGGDKFFPVLYFFDLITIIVQLGLVTLFAVIYPVKIARSITPLDAISRD